FTLKVSLHNATFFFCAVTEFCRQKDALLKATHEFVFFVCLLLGEHIIQGKLLPLYYFISVI
ncbi:MAG: hypothetical protein J6E31_09745, partial [Pyramidobacter sp.]|nr:hypothetical protein [Pyramidobacter sp.]